MNVYLSVPAACRDQKRVLRLLGLEEQTVVSCHAGAGSKARQGRSSAGAPHALSAEPTLQLRMGRSSRRN